MSICAVCVSLRAHEHRHKIPCVVKVADTLMRVCCLARQAYIPVVAFNYIHGAVSCAWLLLFMVLGWNSLSEVCVVAVCACASGDCDSLKSEFV